MHGTIIFLGKTDDIIYVQELIESNEIITDEVNSISSAYEYELENQFGVLYKVEFINNQWFDLITLAKRFSDRNIDIIHALSDGESFIEVISNNPMYDMYSDTDEMFNLAAMYKVDFFKPIPNNIEDMEEEYVEEDEEDYLDDEEY